MKAYAEVQTFHVKEDLVTIKLNNVTIKEEENIRNYLGMPVLVTDEENSVYLGKFILDNFKIDKNNIVSIQLKTELSLIDPHAIIEVTKKHTAKFDIKTEQVMF